MSGLNRLFAGMHTASSALRAERTRVDTIAKNIANARTTRVPGTGEAYRRVGVAEGRRDAQFKFLHLQYAHECSFDFDSFAEPG